MIANKVTIIGSNTATLLLLGSALATLSSPSFAQKARAAESGKAKPAPATPSAATSDTPAPATALAPADGGTIRSIAVSGSQRIEADTVRSYVQLRAGGAYTKATLDQALRDLFATELFADVQIRDNSGSLTIEVKENPVINRVLFEGNKRLKEDKLNPEIKLAPRQIFTASKVRADVGRIIELYRRQGRYGALVEPKKVLLDQNRVDVIYEITEGPKSKVRQINIIGNHEFDDKQVRAQMATQTAALRHVFSSATSYDPDRLAYDQSKLRQFYLTNGFADFRVISAVAELTPDKKDFVITYVVEEGERYKFGEVTVESDIHDLKPAVFQPLVPMQKNDWYNAKAVEDTVDSMTKQAGFFGYAFADVSPQFSRHAETRTMDIAFKVNDVPRVYVERIDVNGNTLTQEKVIRREFRMAEGDAFNSYQIKRSSDRIQSLGFFQPKLEIEQKKGSAEDRIILQANVEEKSTGDLQLSAGYSSLEKLVFSASIAQHNFRGAGQTLRLGGSISSSSKSSELSFTEPYVFNKNIALGLDLFWRSSTSYQYVGTGRSPLYEQASIGFQARAGLQLTEFWSLALRYGLTLDDVTIDQSSYYVNGECSVVLASRYLCDAIGKRTTSTFGYSFVRDTLDNRLRPHNGMRFIFGQDLAGLGGNVRYLRTTMNFAKYKDLGRGFIGAATAEGGAIIPLQGNAKTDPVRLTDRFYLGEPQFSGFDIRGIGPRIQRRYLTDYSLDGVGVEETNPDNFTNFALGGRYYYKGRLEVEVPLGSGAKELGLRPSIFLDIGAVWGGRAPSLINTNSPDPAKTYGNEGYFYNTTSNGKYYQTPVTTDGVTTTTQGYQDYQSAPLTVLVNGQTQSLYTYTENSDLAADAGLTDGSSYNTTCVSGYSTKLGAQTVADGCKGTGSTAIAVKAVAPFNEYYYGNSPRPRLSIGFGINWNSPFGPFRIDVAKALLKTEGDQTKIFTFNVGTQF